MPSWDFFALIIWFYREKRTLNQVVNECPKKIVWTLPSTSCATYKSIFETQQHDLQRIQCWSTTALLDRYYIHTTADFNYHLQQHKTILVVSVWTSSMMSLFFSLRPRKSKVVIIMTFSWRTWRANSEKNL